MRINLRQYKGSGRPCSPIVWVIMQEAFGCRAHCVVKIQGWIRWIPASIP